MKLVSCPNRRPTVSDKARAEAETFITEALKSRDDADRVGIVTFSSNAQLVQALSSKAEFAGIARTGKTSDTALAEAVSLGMLNLPEGTDKRIVVMSDGFETTGDARVVAEQAARHGVRIDTVALSSRATACPVAKIDSKRSAPSLGLAVTCEHVSVSP